jgi:hypothetical protein
MRLRPTIERTGRLLGLVLVLSTLPAASTEAQTATDFVGYSAAASGNALSAFPTVPALLPVEVPAEATLALATVTLSSGGQGFGRSSTFFPGTLIASLRPLLATAAGVDIPIPDYPLVVESREFEGAKHGEQPGLTMISDVDPDRAAATADLGALGLPAILGVRSMRTESTAVLEPGSITATSITRVEGIEIGPLSIGAVVSTSSVSSDGTTSTCRADVAVTGVTVAGTRATIDDDGIHVDDDTPIPGLGLGRTVAELLEAAGLRAQVIGGDESCAGSSGSVSAAGLLISLPLPAIAAIPAGGGITLTLASTSATAGASILPAFDPGDVTVPPTLGTVVGPLPGPFGTTPLPPLGVTPTTPNIPVTPNLPIDTVAYAFDGVPVGLLLGLFLLAIPAATRVRRYMQRILALVGAP